MTQESNGLAPDLIVLGLDDDGKPRAARFPADQADARHRSTSGATLLANRIATHSHHATRCSLTQDDARHRRSD